MGRFGRVGWAGGGRLVAGRGRTAAAAGLALAAALSGVPGAARAGAEVSLEGAYVLTGYNDVRIPGDGGTRFSLSDELDAEEVVAWRLEAGYVRRDRDYFGVVVAPLRVGSRGRLDRDAVFHGATFPAGTDLDATFRFDSYRLRWRRRVLARESLDLWLGLTAKVRDAAIGLSGGGQSVERANTGFVPLVGFRLDWRFAPPWSLRLEGDALAAPQGRAEDVLLALRRDLGAGARLFAGYRVLEGGADNEEVYTFSLFHSAVAGVEVRF